MNDRFEFGDLLNSHIQREERSASWLAQKVGVDRSTVARWLDGSTHPKIPDKILDISRYLHLDQEETNALLISCNFPLAPNQSSERLASFGEQLLAELSVIEPVKVSSSYGLWYDKGPCPPLEGQANLGLVIQNPSPNVAKSIKVDLEIHLLKCTRPKCYRTIYAPQEGWYRLENGGYFWHFRFDGTSDDICLQEDDLPLGTVEFAFRILKDSEDFNNMEDEDYTSLEESTLKNPVILAIGGEARDRFLRERILRLYRKAPAEDTYSIRCRVRAENFKQSEIEATFSVFWANDDIPQLSISGQQTKRFDFNAYADYASMADLRADLLKEIPLGSHVDAIFNFLCKNNIPRVSGEKIGYGFNDRLNTRNVILLMLKVRYSNKTQIINFLFNESKCLEDIKVEFLP